MAGRGNGVMAVAGNKGRGDEDGEKPPYRRGDYIVAYGIKSGPRIKKGRYVGNIYSWDGKLDFSTFVA